MTILAGGVRDAKPYFTDRNYYLILIFCYKFNSTDEFSESWGGVYNPPHATPLTRKRHCILFNVSMLGAMIAFTITRGDLFPGNQELASNQQTTIFLNFTKLVCYPLWMTFVNSNNLSEKHGKKFPDSPFNKDVFIRK